MRSTYIVTYDICDQKRLRRVFRICRDYGNHLQYSVFECDLNAAEKVQLERKLNAVIKNDEDQVLFISLGAAEARGERDITALGKAYLKIDTACFVA